MIGMAPISWVIKIQMKVLSNQLNYMIENFI
jgi:hypothetical protein